MFINGDGNWVNILNDAVITYKNNIHSTINITPVDASNNPDKAKHNFSLRILNPNLLSVIMLGMLTNLTFSLKDTLLIGIEDCLKLVKF